VSFVGEKRVIRGKIRKESIEKERFGERKRLAEYFFITLHAGFYG
jgi:hypothetical protein